MKMGSLRMTGLSTKHFCVPGMLVSIVLTLLSLILSLLLLENPLVTSRNVNLGRIASKNGGTSGAVRVSSGSSTGPEAGEIHRAALARHRYPGRAGGRPSFMDMDDASSDGTNSSDSDFQDI